MTVPLWCLLGFAVWTVLVLLTSVVTPRVVAVLTGRARAGDFPATTPHGTPAYQRAIRAHANCVENLPVFGAVVAVVTLSHTDAAPIDTLAMVYLGARVCQTVTHMISITPMAINVRFTFFLTQLVCVLWMAALVVGRAG